MALLKAKIDSTTGGGLQKIAKLYILALSKAKIDSTTGTGLQKIAKLYRDFFSYSNLGSDYFLKKKKKKT